MGESESIKNSFRLSSMTTRLFNTITDNAFDKEGAENTRHGLYILFFQNKMDQDIYDNNKNREKIVVHRNSISIKPGKFESGFDNRLAGYKNHLHILKSNKEKEFVFRESYLGAIVLNLDQIDVGLKKQHNPRIFENYWILSINKMLEDKRLTDSQRIKQNSRTEWIYAEKEFGERIKQECTGLAKRISYTINEISKEMKP